MHYAVPRILHSAGRLSRFNTDICATQGWPKLLTLVPAPLRPPSVRRLLARKPIGVPTRLIKSYPSFAREYARRRAESDRDGNASATHVWAGERFCALVVGDGLEGTGGVYGFNSASLELLIHARSRGLRAVVEQTMAPHVVEHDILAAERKAFPGWECDLHSGPHAGFAAREKAEWANADVIICGSTFVRDSIAAIGGPSERCRIVPYGVDAPPVAGTVRSRHAGTLRVLVVGAVGLRKGSPYVLAAAKALAGVARVRMVGPVHAAPGMSVELSRHLELLGAIPRSEMADQFRWADVFLLPSLCEGSATVVYEALSWGLPVICTPSTGSVIVDGEDGFVVPARSTDAIVDRVHVLAADEALLHRMAARARRSSDDHTVERYGRRLLEALA